MSDLDSRTSLGLFGNWENRSNLGILQIGSGLITSITSAFVKICRIHVANYMKMVIRIKQGW